MLDKLEAGNYTFRLRGMSLAGNGSWTIPLHFNIPEETGKLNMIHVVDIVIIFKSFLHMHKNPVAIIFSTYLSEVLASCKRGQVIQELCYNK